MEKALILLAGLPGTGKTFLGNLLREKFGAFEWVSQDVLKEELFDLRGYSDLDGKTAIEREAWKLYGERMELAMAAGGGILSDYPFSAKQKPLLQQLASRYGYDVLTIRLTGDPDVLFERQRRRDLDPARHLSHLVSSYKKGQTMEDRSRAELLLTREQFIERCTTRGYDTFELGTLIELDVTDYAGVDYEALMEQIARWNANRSGRR
ncbi:AAA family ATPase [Saccharibacillus sp. CPCC 101409]|uniref:AAA family ATPase n=1 Tax=Saccharibacillus sp. CPCC 101409 TaxID=3058041 RepID=UPI002672D49B|nr:AAA family ATPase [Saccharibacillus sp. CPCC 101409]MDO3408993.1 AAA family ATPase [Saccharibacillus sp. CPCC 101409]